MKDIQNLVPAFRPGRQIASLSALVAGNNGAWRSSNAASLWSSMSSRASILSNPREHLTTSTNEVRDKSHLLAVASDVRHRWQTRHQSSPHWNSPETHQ